MFATARKSLFATQGYREIMGFQDVAEVLAAS
jgi:hypothetical protein